jgi:hypothetical protein
MAPKQTPAAQTQTPAPLDINALLANLPTGASTGTADYIGLPVNTSDPTAVLTQDQAAQGQWAQGRPAAAYANGSQMLPVLQSWHPEDIDNLQRRMVGAGILDQDYRKGVWDPTSQKAFAEVLGLANNMGRPWQDALANYESGTPMQWDAKTGTYIQGTKGTTRTRTPVITNYTSPDDLATTAQEVATAKLGRTFNPDELQKFIAAYHGTEKAAATAQSAGQDYTNPASMKTAATTFAQQTDPNAYNGEQFLPLVDKMNQLLSGPNLATTKPMAV